MKVMIVLTLFFLGATFEGSSQAESTQAEDSGWEELDGSSTNKTADKTSDKTADSEVKATGSAQILYTCPMHSQILRDQPGTCPICGMDLVKKQVAASTPNQTAGSNVVINPVVVQNMGVRVAHVEKGVVSRNVRTIGEVEVAEDQVSVINLRFSGWIEKIWADQTQKKVKKGEALFQIYSPELIAAQEELLLAIRTSGKNSVLAQSAIARLRLWEIPASHINQVRKTGNGQLRLNVRAPRAGFILHKNVVLGKKVNQGVDLYRIGNLSKIWVTAEIYEHDIPWVKLGQKAKMVLSFQEGRIFEGTVSFIYPTLNPKSRTLSVRLEFPNPGLNLKPGMFATVYISVQRKSNVLVIPTEAIIHSGLRKLVFVSKGLGTYEPREIITGVSGDNRKTHVISGLKDKEVVVVSGQFLLDSESQLQEAIQKMMALKLQVKIKPSTSASPPPKQAHDHSHDVGDEQIYTCPMHPQIIKNERGRCPICGMNLVKKTILEETK